MHQRNSEFLFEVHLNKGVCDSWFFLGDADANFNVNQLA
jgi:hypothetical protein